MKKYRIRQIVGSDGPGVCLGIVHSLHSTVRNMKNHTETPTRAQIGELVDEYRDAVERFFDDNALESLNALNAARANLDCALDAALTAEHEARARDAEDAERWRALIGCPRVRMIGGARLRTPYALLGMEFYADYPAECDNTGSVNILTVFADGRRAATRGETPQ